MYHGTVIVKKSSHVNFVACPQYFKHELIWSYNFNLIFDKIWNNQNSI